MTSPALHRRRDLQSPLERLLDRTAIRDRQQPLVLIVGESTVQFHASLDATNADRLRLAVLTVARVRRRFTHSDHDTIQRPTLAVSVHANCHRRTRTERTDEVVVRRRTSVSAAGGQRLVDDECARADGNICPVAAGIVASGDPTIIDLHGRDRPVGAFLVSHFLPKLALILPRVNFSTQQLYFTLALTCPRQNRRTRDKRSHATTSRS